jgi:hypothetical protein
VNDTAAVGLAQAERVPVGVDRDAGPLRRQHGDERPVRERVPGAHGEPVRPDRAGRESLDAVQHVAAGRRPGDEAFVERVEGVAPEHVVLDGLEEQPALLSRVPGQADAGDLQVVESEQVGEGAVGARDDAHDVRDRLPAGARAAEFGRHGQRQQAGSADPFPFARRVAAHLAIPAVAFDGAGGQARGQVVGGRDGVKRVGGRGLVGVAVRRCGNWVQCQVHGRYPSAKSPQYCKRGTPRERRYSPFDI